MDEFGIGVADVSVRWSRDGQSVDTAQSGAFALVEVATGSGELQASCAEGGSTIPLKVIAGETLDDLLVTIEAWGQVVGEALHDDGRPAANAEIRLGHALEFGEESKTDELGRFAFTEVASGDYQVMLVPEGVDGDAAGFFEGLWHQSIVVEPGEQTWVTLRPPKLNPVRVFGRVTSGGAPMKDAHVYLVLEGSAPFSSVRPTESDKNGMYEVHVRQPGPHVLLVAATDADIPQYWQAVDVPPLQSVRADVDVPATRIRGHVRLASGELVPEAVVAIRAETGPPDFHYPGARAYDRAGPDGYAFTHLAPGRYTLSAFVPDGRLHVSDEYAVSVRAGVEVRPGQVRDDVDLVLAPGGTVRGLVVDPQGEPVSGAGIYARDQVGRLLHRYPLSETNVKGEFETAALPEGLVTLTARTPVGTSAESEPLTVRTGAVQETQLRIEPGTWLRVDTVDEEGDPVSAGIRVYDALDRDVSDLRAPGADERVAREGFGTSWLLVGPLPAGVYRAEATAIDGRSGSGRIRLAGEFEEVLEIEL